MILQQQFCVTNKWFQLRCNYLFGFLTENKQLLKLLFKNKRSPFRTKYKFQLVMYKTPNCNRCTIVPTIVPHFFNIFHRAKAWERTYTFVTSQFGITKKRGLDIIIKKCNFFGYHNVIQFCEGWGLGVSYKVPYVKLLQVIHYCICHV